MEKQRGIKILSMVALIVAVLGLTVAFALMSRTLTINGTASMNSASWDVHFANLGNATLTGDASVTTAPTLSDTSIGNYKIVLTKPGDSVTYTFDVVNVGSINAKLGTFTKLATPTCTSQASATADETLVCSNLTYKLTYTDGGTEVAQNDTLNAGETKNLTLTLRYDGDALPSNDVEISGLDISMIYSQD